MRVAGGYASLGLCQTVEMGGSVAGTAVGERKPTYCFGNIMVHATVKIAVTDMVAFIRFAPAAGAL